MINLSFKNFIEQQEEQPNYFSAMNQNLGVKTSALKGVPQWLASAQVGGITYNGIMYKITRFKKDDNDNIIGAFVAPEKNIKGVTPPVAYAKRDGEQVKVPNSSVSTAEVFVPISKLNKIVTQGMDSAGAGGGMGGGGLPV